MALLGERRPVRGDAFIPALSELHEHQTLMQLSRQSAN